MSNYNYAKDIALLQSALSATTSTYPSSVSQYSEDLLGQPYRTLPSISVPRLNMDLANLSPEQFKNFINSLNESYYNINLSKQQSSKRNIPERTVFLQQDIPPKNSTPVSVQSIPLPGITKPKNAQTTPPRSNVRVSLPPTPPSSIPLQTQNSSKPASTKQRALSKTTPIPMIGLFGRVPVTVQEKSPYQFTAEQREKLMREQAEFIRRQQEPPTAKRLELAEDSDRITSIDQILGPIARGLQDTDLVLELDFEIKDSHLNAEPRRYTGPAVIPADLTLDDQKAVVHFMAYMRTTPLPEIDPEYSWLDFRESNSCPKIERIVTNLYRGSEGRAIKESIRTLREAKARRARLHRQEVAKTIKDARQQVGEQEDAAKQAMRKAISEAKLRCSSAVGTDLLSTDKASPYLLANDSVAQNRLTNPTGSFTDETPSDGALPTVPVHAKASEASSSTESGCSEGDLLLFDDDDESEESVAFTIHRDENQLVDISELPSPKISENNGEFELAPTPKLDSIREPCARFETLEEHQPKPVTSSWAQILPIVRTDGFGNYTSVRPPQFSPPPKQKPVIPAQTLPFADKSDYLIDLDIVEESAPTTPAQQLSISLPAMSEAVQMKPLVPCPKVGLLDAYTKFVGKRASGDSTDFGLKLNFNAQKLQSSDCIAENITFVSTKPFGSSKAEKSESGSSCSYKSLLQPVVTRSKTVTPSKSIIPESSYPKVKSNAATLRNSVTPRATYVGCRNLSGTPIASTRASTSANLVDTSDTALEDPSAAYFRDIYSLEAQKEALAALRPPARAETRSTATTQAYPPSLQDSASTNQEIKNEAEKPTVRNLMIHERKVAGGADIHVREWLKRSTFEEAPVVEGSLVSGSETEVEEGIGGESELGKPDEEDLLIVF